MYEASQSRSLDLTKLEASSSGMSLASQAIRFSMCQQQLVVERKFMQVVFEGTTFLQMQFEANHFYAVDFMDCNFSDVVFHGSVFIDCTFHGVVFSNSHFQNCTFVNTAFVTGPVEGVLHITHCLVLGQSKLPAVCEAKQNWIAGDLAEKIPSGFERLERRPSQNALPAHPGSIEKRGEIGVEMPVKMPAGTTKTPGDRSPGAVSPGPKSATRFSELEKL
jgi:hypothetical protein